MNKTQKESSQLKKKRYDNSIKNYLVRKKKSILVLEKKSN